MAVSAWTKHLDTEEEKKQRIESLYRVRWVLEELKMMINTSAEAVEASEISPKSYDNANWAYRQAHANGYKQALRDFSKLLTLDQEYNIGRQPNPGRPVRKRATSDNREMERQTT